MQSVSADILPAIKAVAPKSRYFALLDRKVLANVRWTFLGNALYAASQWVMVVILARITDPQAVGTLALAFAVTAPVTIFFNMQLRAVVATDVSGAHTLEKYLFTRLITAAGALVIIASYIAFAHKDGSTTAVILIIGLAKASESLSDLIHGYWQFQERMELVGKSLTVRAVIGLAGFAIAIVLTRSLKWGAVGFLAGSLVVLLFFDGKRLLRERYIRKTADCLCASPRRLFLQVVDSLSDVRAIVWLAFPLGFSAMLISLNTAIPRYFIDAYFGKHDLGIFAALSYFIVVGNLAMNAVGQSVLPRLARFFTLKKLREFRRLVLGLLLCSAAVAAVSMMVAVLGGRQLLSIYGAGYADAYPVFLIIMAAASVGYCLCILNFTLNAIGAYRVQMPLFLGLTIVLTILSRILIPRYGLSGAATAILITNILQGVISAALVTSHALGTHQPQS
ncbi:MAG: oligosaccharide flippase family protein [Bryobacteraceae bacterium]